MADEYVAKAKAALAEWGPLDDDKGIVKVKRGIAEVKTINKPANGMTWPFDSTAVWTVAPMIIHVKRVTMHSYPG